MSRLASRRPKRRKVKPAPRRAIAIIRTFLRNLAKLEGEPARPPVRAGETR